MNKSLWLSCKNDLDLLALYNHPDFNLEKQLRNAVHAYVSGDDDFRIALPEAPKEKIELDGCFCHLYFNEVKDKAEIQFLKNIRRRFCSSIIKNIFRHYTETCFLQPYLDEDHYEIKRKNKNAKKRPKQTQARARQTQARARQSQTPLEQSQIPPKQTQVQPERTDQKPVQRQDQARPEVQRPKRYMAQPESEPKTGQKTGPVMPKTPPAWEVPDMHEESFGTVLEEPVHEEESLGQQPVEDNDAFDLFEAVSRLM